MCISVGECTSIGVDVYVCIHVYVRVSMYVYMYVCLVNKTNLKKKRKNIEVHIYLIKRTHLLQGLAYFFDNVNSKNFSRSLPGQVVGSNGSKENKRFNNSLDYCQSLESHHKNETKY